MVQADVVADALLAGGQCQAVEGGMAAAVAVQGIAVLRVSVEDEGGEFQGGIRSDGGVILGVGSLRDDPDVPQVGSRADGEGELHVGGLGEDLHQREVGALGDFQLRVLFRGRAPHYRGILLRVRLEQRIDDLYPLGKVRVLQKFHGVGVSFRL